MIAFEQLNIARLVMGLASLLCGHVPQRGETSVRPIKWPTHQEVEKAIFGWGLVLIMLCELVKFLIFTINH